MSILFKSEMRRALLGEECPLCALRREDEIRDLHSLLHEGLSNAWYLKRLSRAGGFCAEHAWALQRLEERDWHDGLTNASFERPLLADAIREIERLPTTTKAVRRARRELKTTPCPACEARARMESIRASNLAEALLDEELSELYVQRKLGLCMPRFRIVWSVEMPEEARHVLATTQHRQLEALLGELDQYLRKHHLHVKELPLPEEAVGWRRAVAVLSGQALSAELGDGSACEAPPQEQADDRPSGDEQEAIHDQETPCRRSSM